MDQPTERIPIHTAWLMIGTAIFFDVIGIIPFLNFAPALAYIMLFPAWFYTHGVSYAKNRSVWWWTIIMFFIGLIPFVSTVLPELSLGVIRNVLYIRREDKKRIAREDETDGEETPTNRGPNRDIPALRQKNTGFDVRKDLRRIGGIRRTS